MSTRALTIRPIDTATATSRRIRLLLINPRFPESFWSFRWALDKMLPAKRTINPPLGLATLAALCPAHWEVAIIDENIEAIPLQPDADIVGICGMGVQYRRQCELLNYYRRLGHYVVAGGSYASLCPERYATQADAVVAGEAEYIWPAFCRDFERQSPRTLYRETGVVALEDSPTPRFDLLKLDRYTTVSMQFSRGCPYRCDFCDIIVMFGRRPRAKTLAQVGRELDCLRERGVINVFFVDDNLIGNKKIAKQLLRYLADYQHRHGHRFRFGTEVSIDVARDTELLALLRAANFAWVFIGIESPDTTSLKESNKTQNLKQDLLTAVRTVYQHGIDVLAGFIIGFDNDTLASFDKQFHFILASGIQAAMIGLLTALPKTPLYQRLQQEGRLLAAAEHSDNTKLGTNILPKGMDYDAMIDAYEALHRRLFNDRNIARRIRAKVRYLSNPAATDEYTHAQRTDILRSLLVRAILPGGPLRWARFLHTLMRARPRARPQVIVDWIAGLAMRDYIKRHFQRDRGQLRRRVQQAAARLHRLCAAGVRRGAVEVHAAPDQGGLQVVLRGYLDGVFFQRAGRRLERLLRRSVATVNLCVEELCAEQRQQWETLLRRLAPYGDRITIWLHERARPLLTVDSSIFQVRLGRSPTELCV